MADTHAHVNPIQVQKFLRHVDYPCTPDELIEKAKEEGANDEVVETLQAALRNKNSKINSPKDVAQAIGQVE